MLRIDDFGQIMAIEYANNVQQQDCSEIKVCLFVKLENKTQQNEAFALDLRKLTHRLRCVQLPTEIKFRPKAVVVPATDAPRYMGRGGGWGRESGWMYMSPILHILIFLCFVFCQPPSDHCR